MGENVVFHVIFDSCDVMYSRSISLLPPIVLANLFSFSPYTIENNPPPYLPVVSKPSYKKKLYIAYSSFILKKNFKIKRKRDNPFLKSCQSIQHEGKFYDL